MWYPHEILLLYSVFPTTWKTPQCYVQKANFTKYNEELLRILPLWCTFHACAIDLVIRYLMTNYRRFCHNGRQIIGHYFGNTRMEQIQPHILCTNRKRNSQTMMKNGKQYRPYNAYFMCTLLIWWYVLVTNYQSIFYFCHNVTLRYIMLNSNW